MIEIKNRRTGAVIKTVDADSLRGANLEGAGLRGADLRGADLREADLRGANIYRADLEEANLRGANLEGAGLRGANLEGANLREANLEGANLEGAGLRGANLEGTRLSHFQIPQEGELIVYKKLHDGSVIKLRVPPEAKRTASLIGRKCRAEFAEVVEGSGLSRHDGVTKYVQGEVVRADKYDDDPRVECTGGIHFFLTRQEAEEY